MNVYKSHFCVFYYYIMRTKENLHIKQQKQAQNKHTASDNMINEQKHDIHMIKL